jgi:hypothetical protein
MDERDVYLDFTMATYFLGHRAACFQFCRNRHNTSDHNSQRVKQVLLNSPFKMQNILHQAATHATLDIPTNPISSPRIIRKKRMDVRDQRVRHRGISKHTHTRTQKKKESSSLPHLAPSTSMRASFKKQGRAKRVSPCRDMKKNAVKCMMNVMQESSVAAKKRKVALVAIGLVVSAL